MLFLLTRFVRPPIRRSAGAGMRTAPIGYGPEAGLRVVAAALRDRDAGTQRRPGGRPCFQLGSKVPRPTVLGMSLRS
jgi:hypothetical protein